MERSNYRLLTVLIVLWVGIIACGFSGGPPGPPPDAVIVTTTTTPNLASPAFTPSQVTQRSPATSTNIAATDPLQTIPLLATDTPITPSATATLKPSETSQLILEKATETQLPTQTSEVSSTPSITPEIVSTADYQLVLSDGFNGGGAWVQSTVDGRYAIGYTTDAYQFTLEIPLIDVWSIRGKTYSDLMQVVDIFDFQGSSDGYAGVVCRWSKSTEYYRFTVSSSGVYRITKVAGGESVDLAQKSGAAINPSAASPVRIRAVCSGDNLVLYSDDQLIIQIQDSDYQSGNFGLMAGSDGNGPMSVMFDNFELYVP